MMAPRRVYMHSIGMDKPSSLYGNLHFYLTLLVFLLLYMRKNTQKSISFTLVNYCQKFNKSLQRAHGSRIQDLVCVVTCQSYSYKNKYSKLSLYSQL